MSEQELSELDDDGEKLIGGPLPLSPQEELFCRAYADPESETYGKATKSAEVAGYVEPHNAAWKLRRRPRIIVRLEQFERITRVQIGKVLTDLEHERKAALEKGDLATAVRASELMGKHLAMFTDRVSVDGPESAERYDALVAEQTQQIVQILLLNQPPDSPSALPEARPEAEQEQVPQAPQERQESE